MQVLFCHGLESSPHGRKYQALVAAGLNVEALDFRGMMLGQRVALLCHRLRTGSMPDVLLGSSYGGITALCAAILLRNQHPVPRLLLCAPALARGEEPASELDLIAPCPTHVIHGTHDQVIPIAVSRDFVRRSPLATLEEVDDDHYLVASLPRIISATRSH